LRIWKLATVRNAMVGRKKTMASSSTVPAVSSMAMVMGQYIVSRRRQRKITKAPSATITGMAMSTSQTGPTPSMAGTLSGTTRSPVIASRVAR
jgi:hypothetical protein